MGQGGGPEEGPGCWRRVRVKRRSPGSGWARGRKGRAGGGSAGPRVRRLLRWPRFQYGNKATGPHALLLDPRRALRIPPGYHLSWGPAEPRSGPASTAALRVCPGTASPSPRPPPTGLEEAGPGHLSEGLQEGLGSSPQPPGTGSSEACDAHRPGPLPTRPRPGPGQQAGWHPAAVPTPGPRPCSLLRPRTPACRKCVQNHARPGCSPLPDPQVTAAPAGSAWETCLGTCLGAPPSGLETLWPVRGPARLSGFHRIWAGVPSRATPACPGNTQPAASCTRLGAEWCSVAPAGGKSVFGDWLSDAWRTPVWGALQTA